jgi:hypothetical protein
MENPAKLFLPIYLIICLSFGFSQEDSTAVDSNISVKKAQESETVNIIATVNPIEVTPTAFRFSIYPRNHPAEPFMRKLFFPGEPIQIILPVNILNTDTLGNIAKMEPLGDAYDIQYRMFNKEGSGEIKLAQFDILVPADIMKLNVVDKTSGNPIPNCHIRVSQDGETLSTAEADTSGYTSVRVPIKRNKEEPVLLSINTDGQFPTWKGSIVVPEGDSERIVKISPIKLDTGETIYEVIDELVPFREGPENGSTVLFLLNEGDQLVISKVAGDRLFGRTRIYLDNQSKYQNVNGWILGKHVYLKDN